MLDATERILQDEGYAALTSRNVAEKAGAKQRLVYYYFATMDELIVETFRRLADRELDRLQTALSAPHPLQEAWKVFVYTSDTKLVSEFAALANRIDGLRVEVRAHIERCRDLQVEALERTLAASSRPARLSPLAATILANATALALHREAAIGITRGHSEVLDVIADFISAFDPGDADPPTTG